MPSMVTSTGIQRGRTRFMPETPRAAWIANNSLASDSAPESFHGLLLRHRGRIGLTQRQLAARIGVSARTVQDWEAGVNHASVERLQALIGVYATMGGFAAGRWAGGAGPPLTAGTPESARLRTPLDHSWVAALLGAPQGDTNTA